MFQSTKQNIAANLISERFTGAMGECEGCEVPMWTDEHKVGCEVGEMIDAIDKLERERH